MSNIRYVITGVKPDGTRQMINANNHLNTYATEAEAELQLINIYLNNNYAEILKLMGRRLRVTPVECFSSGDATRTVFPSEVDDVTDWIKETIHYLSKVEGPVLTINDYGGGMAVKFESGNGYVIGIRKQATATLDEL